MSIIELAILTMLFAGALAYTLRKIYRSSRADKGCGKNCDC